MRGHTVEIADVTYGDDADGAYSLIHVISQRGDGGAGGANTGTGAHDQDALGTIKVYGDRVRETDIEVQAADVFDGVDRLDGVDALVDYNGGVQHVMSSTDGDVITTAPFNFSTRDQVEIGVGAQTVSTGAGRDFIGAYGDAGASDPAQTDGADGRVTTSVDPSQSADAVSGGSGADTFTLLDKTRGATITDWEGGADIVDFPRAENVDDLSDIRTDQTSAMIATIAFENDEGQDVEVDVMSITVFELTAQHRTF